MTTRIQEIIEVTRRAWKPSNAEPIEKALSLQQVAECLGLSYHTVFQKRHAIGFQLPGSRLWRVWPSTLAELSKPRNNLTRLTLRVQEQQCQSAKISNRVSGGSISDRQAAKELDALLARPASKPRRSITTS